MNFLDFSWTREIFFPPYYCKDACRIYLADGRGSFDGGSLHFIPSLDEPGLQVPVLYRSPGEKNIDLSALVESDEKEDVIVFLHSGETNANIGNLGTLPSSLGGSRSHFLAVEWPGQGPLSAIPGSKRVRVYLRVVMRYLLDELRVSASRLILVACGGPACGFATAECGFLAEEEQSHIKALVLHCPLASPTESIIRSSFLYSPLSLITSQTWNLPEDLAKLSSQTQVVAIVDDHFSLSEITAQAIRSRGGRVEAIMKSSPSVFDRTWSDDFGQIVDSIQNRKRSEN